MPASIRTYWEKLPLPHSHQHEPQPFTSQTAARVLTVLLGAQGIACMLFTQQIHTIFPYLLGSLMVITGLCDMYRGFVTKEYYVKETKLIANGMVMLLLGLVILLHDGNRDNIIGGVWGAIGLFKGSEELNVALYRKFGKQSYWKEAVHAAVELLLAMILLVDPLTAVEHHVFILGLELTWHSLKLYRETKSTPTTQPLQ